ncbi:MAG: nucleotidyl transferase AbiEii/AbiGii toxin family protein [Proteobacteria bacterium]|nr:nucleotidyl transferase AbiEii/AbiGii toxin family protein [Pseudomonadota bacterium]
MINRAQITRRSADEKVSARTVERDYILAHIIAAVSNIQEESGLIFKGGTALRLCYFEDYRYSADLDFSMLDGSVADGTAAIQNALQEMHEPVTGLRLTNQNPPRIAYTGPLGRERYLKLDIADDELILETEMQALLPRWPDLPENTYVLVYSLQEIAGEKLRCVIQRLQCRDLYDLYLLFGDEGVDVEYVAGVFSQKAAHRGIDPTCFAERYRARLIEYRQRWDAELEIHIPGAVPHFDEVERQVSRYLRSVNLL